MGSKPRSPGGGGQGTVGVGEVLQRVPSWQREAGTQEEPQSTLGATCPPASSPGKHPLLRFLSETGLGRPTIAGKMTAAS